MRDPYFGHRHPFTGEPLRDKEEWTSWDYALVSAFQMIEDFTGKDGLLVWEKDSERVQVEAIRKIDKFQQAVENVTSRKNYKAQKGETFYPNLKLLGGEWPTATEYFDGIAKDGTIEGD